MLVDIAERFDQNVEAGQVKVMRISSAPAVQRAQVRVGCCLPTLDI